MIGWFANAIMCGFDRQIPEIQRLQADNALLLALAKLGRWVLDQRPEGECTDLSKAIELGLLVEVIATEPCGDECSCNTWSTFPVECLQLTDRAKVLDVDP